jgi:hypothetical protein
VIARWTVVGGGPLHGGPKTGVHQELRDPGVDQRAIPK